MFATKEIKKQAAELAPSSRKQTSRDAHNGTRSAANLPVSTRFLQRYIGNNHIEAMIEDWPASRQRAVDEMLQSSQPLVMDNLVGGCNAMPETIQRQSIEREENLSDETREKLKKEEGIGEAFTTSCQLKQLVIGNRDDPYEKEADRVADEVIRRDSKKPGIQNSLLITPISIQRQSNHSELRTIDLSLNRNNGQPIDRHVRRDMESLFGYTFEDVHVHNDAETDRLARSINARAFTVGNDIFFRRNEYNPTSSYGKRLLAHELTHVIQQDYSNTIRPKKVNENLQRAEDEEGAETNDDLQEFERRKEADRRELQGRGGGSVGAARTELGGSETTVSPFEGLGIQRHIMSWIQRNNECGDPSLTRQGRSRLDLDSDSWRAYVYAYSTASATNDRLTVNLWARGGTYYVIWMSFGRLDFTATVDISCREVGETCEIFANERAGSTFKASDSPISGGIAIQTQRRANNTELALTPRTGAAVAAGGSVGAGIGPYSIGVSFPGGGMSRTRSHGTFRWSCS